MESLQSLLLLVKKVASRMWRMKVVSLACLGTSLLLMIAIAFVNGPAYTSEMMVRPVGNAISPQMGMLAGLVSPNFRNSSLGQTNQLPSYLNLLQSDDVAAILLKQPDVVRAVFGDSIDLQTGLYRGGFMRRLKADVNAFFGQSTSDRPTVFDMQSRLDRLLVVSQDQLTQIVTVTCTSSDRFQCPIIMKASHRAAEGILSGLIRQNAVAMRDYVEPELNRVTAQGVRDALIQMLAQAETQIATSYLGQPVAAEVFAGPTQPDSPTFPRPGLLLVLGIFMGLGAAAGITWYLTEKQVSSRQATESNSRSWAQSGAVHAGTRD
jgi:uncharacterized protein involved in exopolysaccharide biosynthesis